MKKSDLPFGSEFSPSQIKLKEALEIVKKHEGNWKDFEYEILAKYFSKNRTSDYNKKKLANNTKLAMIAYGIIDKNVKFTEFGKELYLLKDDNKALYDLLAKQILLNLQGMNFVQCIKDMMRAGETINLSSIRKSLEIRGIHYPSGGKHPSIMRLWLEKAGVFEENSWRVNEKRINELLDINIDEFERLASLTNEQKAFLLALANTLKKEPQSASDITKLATATYGVSFPEKSLPKLVLNELEEKGYIIKQKTTTGRGAKPFLISPTEKLKLEIIEPLLQQISKQTDPKLYKLLRKSLIEIIEELDSENKHVRGLALEALGFKLMLLIGMKYVATRLRGISTGGAEVDLIFESTRLVYSRWQIQCKNTKAVMLDDVAKEVGLTHFLKSNAIVIVTTGKVGREARRYANKIMSDSNIAIVMIDGKDLKKINDNPSEIVNIFEREAKHAMELKKLDI